MIPSLDRFHSNVFFIYSASTLRIFHHMYVSIWTYSGNQHAQTNGERKSMTDNRFKSEGSQVNTNTIDTHPVPLCSHSIHLYIYVIHDHYYYFIYVYLYIHTIAHTCSSLSSHAVQQFCVPSCRMSTTSSDVGAGTDTCCPVVFNTEHYPEGLNKKFLTETEENLLELFMPKFEDKDRDIYKASRDIVKSFGWVKIHRHQCVHCV